MLTQGCQCVKIDLTKSQANMTADFCSANINEEIQQFYWVHDRYGLGVMVCKNGHISVIVDQLEIENVPIDDILSCIVLKDYYYD